MWPSHHPHELMSMQPSFSTDAVGRSQKEGLSVLPCCCVRCAFWHVKSGNKCAGDPQGAPRCHPQVLVSFSGTEWTAIGLSRAWGLRLFPGAKKAAPFYYLAHSAAFSLITWPASPKDIGLTDCRCAPKKCPLYDYQNAVLTKVYTKCFPSLF